MLINSTVMFWYPNYVHSLVQYKHVPIDWTIFVNNIVGPTATVMMFCTATANLYVLPNCVNLFIASNEYQPIVHYINSSKCTVYMEGNEYDYLRKE